jgi:hypothetical protein
LLKIYYHKEVNKKQTSRRVATIASKQLRSQTTSKRQKSVDASALAQAKGKNHLRVNKRVAGRRPTK